jgi:Glu-tRNA(Gln) amidotransferase subunit E-like FAD-binding protein
LKEEDLQTFDEGEMKEEKRSGEFHEQIFKEGELEQLAEEATRDQHREEIPEGALAEAIEEFTGEPVSEEKEIGVRPGQEKPSKEAISGAVKELVEGMSAKILPQLTKAIADAATEKIDRAVKKIVPEMAEEAIRKEIRRLETLKKGEDFDT